MDWTLVMMEGIVVTTGVVRILLVALVFFLNAESVLRPRPSCLHALTSEALLLCNIIYLLSWLPFLIYSLLNGRWVLVDEQVYCLLQNFITNALSMIMLGLLLLRLVARIRLTRGLPAVTPGRALLLVFAVWVCPQMLYEVTAAMSGYTHCRHSVFRFLDDLIVVEQRSSDVEYKGYRIGFMICEQELSAEVVHQHIWQYGLIVLPFCLIVLVCACVLAILKCRKNNSKLSVSSGDIQYVQLDVQTRCHSHSCTDNSVIIDTILYINFLWHFLLRPLFIVHVVVSNAADGESPMFMDFGSHLILTIASVFAPLSPSSEVRVRKPTLLTLMDTVETPEKPTSLTDPIQATLLKTGSDCEKSSTSCS